MPPIFTPIVQRQVEPRPRPFEDMPDAREHRRHLARILGLAMQGHTLDAAAELLQRANVLEPDGRRSDDLTHRNLPSIDSVFIVSMMG